MPVPFEQRLGFDKPLVEQFFRYTADLPGLPLDGSFTYVVKLDGKVVREQTARTRVGAGKPTRFIMVGDLADPDVLNGVARFLEEEWRLAAGVRTHLAGVRRIVATDAIDAADRKDIRRADNRDESRFDGENGFGAGLGHGLCCSCSDGGNREATGGLHKIAS